MAAEGSGVLILADGHPEKTTEVEPAVFDEADRKHLRLYLEYPSRLPDTFGRSATGDQERTRRGHLGDLRRGASADANRHA